MPPRRTKGQVPGQGPAPVNPPPPHKAAGERPPRPKRVVKDDGRVVTAIRLDRDLHGKLKQAARERAVGVNWLIARLLAESVDRLIPADEVRLTRPRELPDVEVTIEADTTAFNEALAAVTSDPRMEWLSTEPTDEDWTGLKPGRLMDGTERTWAEWSRNPVDLIIDPALHDLARLNLQLRRVVKLMERGEWVTLYDLAEATGDPLQSISARLRDLRKKRFGSHIVQRRRQGEASRGIFEYRLVWNEATKTVCGLCGQTVSRRANLDERFGHPVYEDGDGSAYCEVRDPDCSACEDGEAHPHGV